MKLYQKLIRPMHSYPGPDYSPRVMPIELEVKWYPEEERERLEKKYASYNEGSFSDLIFEEKYENVRELVRCKDCKHWSAERINDFNKCRRWINVGVKNFATMGDWFCADGERRESE